ncbi:hypothetical protein ACHAWF_011503 [Thalassiosira exigua]
MASKAWYKPSALPQLIAKFEPPTPLSESTRRKSVEVWTTTCIVTNFGVRREDVDADVNGPPLPRCSTLVNPANPGLTGPNSFPYFPRGGPQPRLPPNRQAHHIMGYVSQWGGMDVGGGMMFAAETIDGPAGGSTPSGRQATESGSEDGYIKEGEAKCPVGAAVMTSPGGDELRQHYDCIVHTTPPFYNHPPRDTAELRQRLGIEYGNVSCEKSWSKDLLRSCYRQSFQSAFGNDAPTEKRGSFLLNPLALLGLNNLSVEKSNKRVAVPLLGGGCRAFPKDVALEVAALESTRWLSEQTEQSETSQRGTKETIAFGLLEDSDAEELADRIRDITYKTDAI